jgi:pimeloyl-ACP methyl ester carboxylesterase
VSNKIIKSGGLTTSYLEAGTAGKQPIVLVHDGAFGASGEISWGRFIPHVADDYHVFAPDLLGWGGSDKVVFFDRAPYAPRVAQLRDFCDQLGISHAIFMGVSFGASVLLRWATEADSPPPASLVVAVNGTGGPMRKPEGLQALANFDPPTPEAMTELMLWLVDEHPGLDEHVAARFVAAMKPGHWEAMMAIRVRNPEASPLPQDTFLEDLGRVTTPIAFVEGTRDKLLEPGWSAVLQEKTPGSVAVSIDAQHEPNIDNPAALAEVLRTLVSK